MQQVGDAAEAVLDGSPGDSADDVFHRSPEPCGNAAAMASDPTSILIEAVRAAGCARVEEVAEAALPPPRPEPASHGRGSPCGGGGWCGVGAGRAGLDKRPDAVQIERGEPWGRRHQGTSPMTKAPLTILTLLALAACAPMGARPSAVGAAASAAPSDRLVAAIETEGCLLTRDNVGAVLLRANLTQADLTSLAPQLAAAGRAEVSGEGTIRVLSDNCI